MSKAAQQLGRLLKPPSPLIGVTTGEVISTTPLMIRVGDKITARAPKLFYAAGLTFEVGDNVIIIASTDNQRFYVVGRMARA